MLWIGLSGSMGSGKSAVAQILRDLGYAVLDADEEARKALAPASEGLKKVVQAFGLDLLHPDGTLNREKLGQIVFKSKEKLALLESLVHPVVQSSVRAQKEVLEKSGAQAAFYDVPLLFEKRMQPQFDKILVVNSNLENMIQRVQKRSALSRQEILDRLANQIPLSQKVEQADVVIENNGTLKELQGAVNAALSALKLPTKA